jgi:hypothetical protein
VYYEDRDIILLEQCDKPSLFQVGEDVSLGGCMWQRLHQSPPHSGSMKLAPSASRQGGTPAPGASILRAPSTPPRLPACSATAPPPALQAITFASAQRSKLVGSYFNITQETVNG